MMRRTNAILCSAAFAIAALGLTMSPSSSATAADATSNAPTHPEPSRSPISWELNFKYGQFERVTITTDGKQSVYWFVRYSVTNNSGRDVLFTPSFELLADTGVAYTAFKEANGKDNIPSAVYDKVKELYKNTMIQSPNSVFGKLLQGEDNARDSVAIFPALDPEARDFKLFVMGLSGETATAVNAATGKNFTDAKGKDIILQKTLELDYKLAGMAIGIEPSSRVTGIKWIMK